MFPLDGKFEVDVYCVYKFCLFELSSCTNKIARLVLTLKILELVLGCQEKQSYLCERMMVLRKMSKCVNRVDQSRPGQGR